MKVFDLHCDTIGECYKQQKRLRSNDMHLSLEQLSRYEEYCQVFAIWITDDKRGQTAVDYFDSVADLYYNSVEENADLISVYGSGKNTPVKGILACEGGSACGGTLEGLRHLYDRGVRLVTLTWNANNEIGGGVFSEGGLTPFGVEFVKECERLGIVIDVSHLNRETFWDVDKIATKPFIASHSNADIVDNFYGHKRNLDEAQIKAIRDRGGLIGLNFCYDFLQQQEYPGLLSLGEQIRYLLALGCEDVIALGSDYDGCDMIDELKGACKMKSVYEALLSQGIGEAVLDKIFYENANRFFNNNI
ncbi:MAG: membrane dipeptidase [Clostridia bacterium]|nr:membrane dipeptidase [Clostridia bacterium]